MLVAIVKECVDQIRGWLIVTALVVLFFAVPDSNGNVGVMQIVGYHIVQGKFGEEITYNNSSDFRKISAEATKGRIGFSFDTSLVTPHADVAVNLDDYISVINCDGEPNPYKIVGMFNDAGEDMLSLCQNNIVTFPKSGVYTLVINAEDDTNRLQKERFTFPVMR